MSHSVPYLDPTFEALVKIQLRFCAEAYSRMAQVQQYVGPLTYLISKFKLTSCSPDILTLQREISTHQEI